MKKYIISFILVILLVSCATWTPEQKEYMGKIKDIPLTFNVPQAKDKEYWSRAQTFLAKHSSMKIQIATEYVLQTYNPQKDKFDFGYSVTKTVISDSISYSVDCFSGSDFASAICSRNAKILAYYIQTGEIRGELVIK